MAELTFYIDARYTLTVPGSASFPALLGAVATVHPDVPDVVPSGHSVVFWVDEAHWVQLEGRPAGTLGQWLDDLPQAEMISARVFVGERCNHGAPGILGGYACGRC